GGISGATRVHGSSVRSEGYVFRNWSFFHIRAHSSAEGICTNSLTNTSFCQALFPDSLSQPRYGGREARAARLPWAAPNARTGADHLQFRLRCALPALAAAAHRGRSAT